MESSSSSSAAAAEGSMQFPEHMAEAVLVKLPVQTLLRLKLLSKSFKSLIEDPSFVAAHLHSSSQAVHCHGNPPSLALLTENRNDDGTRVNKLLTLTKQHDDHHPDQVLLRKEEQLPTLASDHDDGAAVCIDLVGSHNGLICLRHRYDHPRKNKLVLWNPATKQSRTLPPLTWPSPHRSSLMYYCTVVLGHYWVADLGFAYNRETDDYLVSQIVSLVDDHNQTNLSYELDIFSMQRWEWQTYTYRHELPGNIPSGCMTSNCPYSSVTLRGSVYQVVQVQVARNTCCSFVLAMDLANTIGNDIVFRRIEFPLDGVDFPLSKLTVYGEGEDQSLGLINNVYRQFDQVPCFKCNMWVLKMDNTNKCSSAWTKLFTISIMHSVTMNQPMTSWGDGRIIIRRTIRREEENAGRRCWKIFNTLYMYDHRSMAKNGEYMEDELVGANEFISANVCPYVESLVSLHPS